MTDRLAEIRARSSRDLPALTCPPVPSPTEQERVVDVAFLLAEIDDMQRDHDELCDRYTEETEAYQAACDRYRAEIARLTAERDEARKLIDAAQEATCNALGMRR